MLVLNKLQCLYTAKLTLTQNYLQQLFSTEAKLHDRKKIQTISFLLYYKNCDFKVIICQDGMVPF